MADVLAKLRPGMTVHGFCLTSPGLGGGDRLPIRTMSREMALAHAIPNEG